MTLTTEMPEVQVVSYDVTDAVIAQTRARCAELSADTPAGYEAVRIAVADLRGTRTAIERRRVELKTDALAYGRRVDGEAKRFTKLLLEIEEPLSQKKHDVDYEKSRLRLEAESAKQAALEAKIRAAREAEEARLADIRAVEEQRLTEERARLEAERAQLTEERRKADETAQAERERVTAEALAAQASQRAEREAIDADRRAVTAAREHADRIEFERLARIKAEAEALERIERDRLAAAKRQAAIDAVRPDVEKVRVFAQSIRAVPVPKPRTAAGKQMVDDGLTALERVAASLETAAKKWA